MKSTPARLVTCTGIVCLLASGCTSMESYKDANDPCNSYRQTLITTQEDADQTFAVGTAVSAGVGLAAGIACAVLTKNTGKCVGIGAGTALLGTGIAYWQSQREKATNRAELQAAIDGEARAAGEKLTPIGGAVSGLNQCRMNQTAQLQQSFVGNQIDKPTATRDLAKIDASIAKDQELINHLLGVIDQRATQLAQDKANAMNLSLATYQERLPTPQPARTAPPTAPRTPAPATPSTGSKPAKPMVAQAPHLSRQPKPAVETADATADLYLNAKDLAVLNHQQHEELVAASGNLRKMIDIGGGGTVSRALLIRLSMALPMDGMAIESRTMQRVIAGDTMRMDDRRSRLDALRLLDGGYEENPLPAVLRRNHPPRAVFCAAG